jgi:hypothetical protein
MARHPADPDPDPDPDPDLTSAVPDPDPDLTGAADGSGSAAEGEGNPVALALFEYRLAQIGARERRRQARRNLWLAHHWPDDYQDRCAWIGSRPVCRRCAALYPLGFLVAFTSALGYAPWPSDLDPWPIWLLSLPATVAYVGEAVGWFRYHVRWQVGTTLVAALAFGRALGYELNDRWHPWFWGPIAVFGAIWFAATVIATRRSRGQMVATASSSSSSVL